MAANIEFNEQRQSYSIISTEPTWHHLESARYYDKPLTTIEALKGCNADFNVEKQPIVALTPELVELVNNGQFINASMLKDLIVDGSKATMRMDNHCTLGIVSDKYGVVQNSQAFDFIDAFCTGGTGAPCIESAGVLGNGGRVFVSAKFPEAIRLAHKDNDLVNMYVVFTTSHDGKGAVTAMVTPIRVVCNNTLNAAFANNSGRWNVRHTCNVGNHLTNIAEASRAMGLYEVYKEEFEGRMEQLSKVHLTDKDVDMISARALMTDDVWKAYVKADYNINSDDISTRTKNQFEALKQTIYTGVGQDLLETNTGLHLYNGITCYLTNVAPKDWSESNKEAEKQFNSLMVGTAYEKQQKAFELILNKVA